MRACIPIFVFAFLCAVVETRRVRRFHSTRDHDFVGEDPRIARALARRMGAGAQRPGREGRALEQDERTPRTPHPPATRADLARLGIDPPPSPFPPPPPPSNETRRAWERTHLSYPADTFPKNLYGMQLKAMEQAIYSTQYRILEMEHIMRGYKEDPRFRIAFIFRRLDEWMRDVRIYYEYVTHADRKDVNKFLIYRHIIYYSYILRRDIDVTYSIDYLLELHNEMAKKAKTAINPEIAKYMKLSNSEAWTPRFPG